MFKSVSRSGARLGLLSLVLLASLASISCLAIDANVDIGADGSGTLILEYRVSRMVESMGKLDGTERWLPFPVGRADFERGLEGREGLSLSRFSSKSDETDIRISAELRFDSLEALVSFLSANGRTASFIQKDGKSTLSLRLSDSAGPLDPDLETLVRTVFEGYDIRIQIRTPGPFASDGVDVARIDARTAVFSSPVADLLARTQETRWTLSW